MVGESDAPSQPARVVEPLSSEDPGSIEHPTLPPLSPVSQFEHDDDSQPQGAADDNFQRESDAEHTKTEVERLIPDSETDRSV